MRQSLLKDWFKSKHWVQSDHVLLIDKWFEVSELGKTVEHLCKLVAVDAIVLQKESIYEFTVKDFARRGQALDVSLTKEIVLQANGLLPDLVEDGKG